MDKYDDIEIVNDERIEEILNKIKNIDWFIVKDLKTIPEKKIIEYQIYILELLKDNLNFFLLNRDNEENVWRSELLSNKQNDHLQSLIFSDSSKENSSLLCKNGIDFSLNKESSNSPLLSEFRLKQDDCKQSSMFYERGTKVKKYLLWIQESSKIICECNKVPLLIHQNNVKNIDGKLSISRASYKLCNFYTKCKNKQNCRYQHFAHDMIYADINAVNEYMELYNTPLLTEFNNRQLLPDIKSNLNISDPILPKKESSSENLSRFGGMPLFLSKEGSGPPLLSDMQDLKKESKGSELIKKEEIKNRFKCIDIHEIYISLNTIFYVLNNISKN